MTATASHPVLGAGTPAPAVSGLPPRTAAAAPAARSDACPLCGAPLHPTQGWCLRCGAAARTRLAAAPGWKAPLVTVAAVAALALGLLAAALVKLAADSGPAPAAITRTVIAPAVAAAPAPTATTPTVAGTGTPVAPGTGGAAAPSATATTPAAGTHTATTPAAKAPANPSKGSTTTSKTKEGVVTGGVTPGLARRLKELQAKSGKGTTAK